MTVRLNKNFLHVKGDYLVLEYIFEDVSDLNILLKDDNDALTWKVKHDNTTLISKNMLSGISIDSANPKLAKVILSPADTSSLTPGKYAYQLRILDLNSNPITVALGEMDLRDSF